METEHTSKLDYLLSRYNKPGPRYTSYPTAPVWPVVTDSSSYINQLKKLARSAGRPISLYLHIPFCEDRCLYCACNVSVRADHSVADRFLQHLETEIKLVADQLGFKPVVESLHLGGGTPTYLSPEQIHRVMDLLNQSFDINFLSGELSVEIDPVVTTNDHLDALTEEGFQRFSFGVQDFNPAVQEAVKRIQTFEDTYKQVSAARERGAQSVNVDLIYGLPLQTAATFRETLKKTLLLDPDRLALFSYAHVPWIHKHQQVLDQYQRPEGLEKLSLLMDAKDFLESAGYRLIGMDHFAKPEDELSVALDEGRLRRNFMGYTTLQSDTILAFGPSSIGSVGGTYVQNQKNLKQWETSLSEGRLAIEHAYSMTTDDRIRQRAIMDIMVQFAVFYDEFKARTGETFTDYFREELAGMDDLEADGLITRFPDRLVVTDLGELFVRNVAMRFDRYLMGETGPRRFSQTV